MGWLELEHSSVCTRRRVLHAPQPIQTEPRSRDFTPPLPPRRTQSYASHTASQSGERRRARRDLSVPMPPGAGTASPRDARWDGPAEKSVRLALHAGHWSGTLRSSAGSTAVYSRPAKGRAAGSATPATYGLGADSERRHMGRGRRLARPRGRTWARKGRPPVGCSRHVARAPARCSKDTTHEVTGGWLVAASRPRASPSPSPVVAAADRFRPSCPRPARSPPPPLSLSPKQKQSWCGLYFANECAVVIQFAKPTSGQMGSGLDVRLHRPVCHSAVGIISVGLQRFRCHWQTQIRGRDGNVVFSCNLARKRRDF
jgi:hypothetical protein